MPTVYLAGPDVFLPEAVELGRRKKALCARYGLSGLFPLDNEAPPASDLRVDRLIYAANVTMMQRADCGIFNLTPFRGPSADVGTVFELGLLTGLGKPAFGYTTVATSLRARVADAQQAEGGWIDANGWMVEDFGNADNLMIDACLALPGNGLVRVDVGGRLDDLAGFELCLQMAAKALGCATPLS